MSIGKTHKKWSVFNTQNKTTTKNDENNLKSGLGFF